MVDIDSLHFRYTQTDDADPALEFWRKDLKGTELNHFFSTEHVLTLLLHFQHIEFSFCVRYHPVTKGMFVI